MPTRLSADYCSNLETLGLDDDTIGVLMSDNGAQQERYPSIFPGEIVSS